MKRSLINIFTSLILLLLISANVKAQLSVDFSANITEDCSPMPVDFTTTGTDIGSVVSYEWSFGFAGGSSVFQNPSTTYNNVGVYSVTLTLNKGLADETKVIKSNYIQTYAKPVASFTVSTDTACAPFSIDFQDQTTPTGYSITQWSWDFKNSTVLNNSTQSAPSSNYTSAGTYKVSLIVENPDLPNCLDSAVQNIVILNQPTASFTTNPSGACSPPLDVTFDNNSTAGLQYIWYFDNGNDSTTTNAADIIQNYDAYANYYPSLTVTGHNGSCEATVSGEINIVDVVANFTVNTTVTCVGSTVLFNANSSQSANSYSWDFGDNSTGTGATKNHVFNAPGTYNVQVIATHAQTGCSDVKDTLIYVEDAVANFSVTETYFCQAPASVTFTDLSTTDGTGFKAWSWLFDDGGSSIIQNPTHNYAEEGVFDVKLTATTINNCPIDTTFIGLITVSYPSAGIDNIDPIKGCEDLVVTFTDGSTPDVAGTIVDWQWEFGEGNSTNETTAGASVENIYLEHGTYYVTLTVVNDRGCINSVVDSVKVGSKPIAAFSVSPTPSCARDTIYYTDESTFEDISLSPDLLDEWIWSGSGGFGSSIQDPKHLYDQVDAIGFNSAKLIVGYNGCYDTLELTNIVEIYGPIIESINQINPVDCDSSYERTFAIVAGDTTQYYWIIAGVGGVDTIDYGSVATINPNSTLGGTLKDNDLDTLYYKFPTTGVFSISVVAINENPPVDTFDPDFCEFIKGTLVTITDVKAIYTISNDSICKGATTSFNGSVSDDVLNWKWNFGDGISTGFGNDILSTTQTSVTYIQPKHQYIDTGKYFVNLTVQDIFGCESDTIDSVYVFQPRAGFISDSLYGCSVFNVNFSDTSVSDIPIVNWIWDFGSGPISTTSPNVPASFSAAGIKTTFLTITDALGCKDDASLSVEVIRPSIGFIGDSTICQGESVMFTNQSTPYNGSYPLMSYQWDFGIGQIFTDEDPQIVFQDTGYFDVKVTITDALGCVAKTTVTDYLLVQGLPEIGIGVNQTLFLCNNPAAVEFTDTTKSDYLTYYEFDYGDGGIPYTWIYTPMDPIRNLNLQRNYFERGTYDVSVTYITSYGCKIDSILEDFFVVDGPYAEFSITDTTVCLNDTLTFKIDTLNYLVDSWEWRFGDGMKVIGQIDTSDTQITYAYTNLPTDGSGFFNATLRLYNSDGECPIDTTANVYIFAVGADYLMNGVDDDTLYSCPPFEVAFTDQSNGANNWSWDFDNGTTSTAQNPPNVNFAVPDTFEVSLNIDGNVGESCADDKIKYVIIYPVPQLEISNDTVICSGDEIQIKVKSSDSNVTYDWKPSVAITNDSIFNPLVKPTVDTEYSVEVTNLYECKSQDTVFVDIIPIPTMSVDPVEASIIIGDTLDILATVDDEEFKLWWEPEKDLKCYGCKENKFFGLENSTFIIYVQDTLELCPPKDMSVFITVNEWCNVDVADAISPDEDKNNIIRLRGWGVEEVLFFEISNRWGEVVYKNPGDFNHAWDGTFNGIPQPTDTYMLVAKVKLYCEDEPRLIKKQISLFR